MVRAIKDKGLRIYDKGRKNPQLETIDVDITTSDKVDKKVLGNVILATKISAERCERINLGYMNPDEINPADYQGREDEGILYVPKAGEILYRLKNPPDWQ